jgi:natural product precursor
MKQKKFGKKLTLNKSTVTNLDNRAMNHLQGGTTFGTCAYTCEDPCTTRLNPTCKGCPFILTFGATCEPC